MPVAAGRSGGVREADERTLSSRAMLSRLSGFCLMTLALMSVGGRGKAEELAIQRLEATHGEEPARRLPKVMDGRDTGDVGWSVYPRTGERHSLMAQIAPTHALAFDLTFCFLSGQPKRYFGHFALSLTTDPEPSLAGNWQRVVPQSGSALGTSLTVQPDGSVTSAEGDRMIGDAIFQLRVPAPAGRVTGFRVEVIPFERPEAPGPRVSWNEYRDFCLTEWRVTGVQESSTTNVALGCAVMASHTLWAGGSAQVLTDGLPGSFIHPADPGLGAAFYFEIDLRSERPLDHLVIRSRADGFGTHHLSQLKVQVLDQPGAAGGEQKWEYLVPQESGDAGSASIAILRAADGRGNCRGRYLRVSSESGAAHAPQLAEVEAYPVLTPRVRSITANGRALSVSQAVAPAGTGLVEIALEIPGSEIAPRLPVRWRLRGWQDDWETTEERVVKIVRPSGGDFRFEAQVGHSDREWDASVLSIPLKIRIPFWKTTTFQWAWPSVVVIAAAATMRRIGRQRELRRLAVLKHQSALAEERSRIARDMHDEVGARLCQLAMMQDLMLKTHELPEKARENLREIARNTRQTVDALDHVVWAVNPQHDSLDGVANYIAHSATSYLTPLDITCRLDLPFEWPDVTIRSQARHHLILAIREALQNIVKHAGAKTVTLSMRYESPELRLLIADDGCGLKPGPTDSGQDGIANMKARLAAIGGTCEVRNREQGGTEVEMRAPLPSDENNPS